MEAAVNSTIVSAPPTEGGSRRSPVGRAPRSARALAGLVVLLVLLQRFGVPFGSFVVPVLLPVGLALGAVLLYRGSMRVDTRRAALFAAGGGSLGLAAYVASWGSPARLPALVMVLAVFAVWLLRATGRAADNGAGARFVTGSFVWVMLAAAVVAILQMLLQLSGRWSYSDPIEQWVPSQFLLPDYNTSIPISYGSGLYKSQAVVFLEPSVYSQFAATAVVAAVVLRRPAWQLVLLLAGLVTALSGTGLILLGFGLVLLAPSWRRLRPSYVVVMVVALLAVVLSPAGDILRGRAEEVNNPTSSLGLRFVMPYGQVADGLGEDPARWVHGAGPGAADRELESGRTSAGLFVVYPAPAKLLFEYGLVPALLFLTYIVTTMFRGAPSRVMATVLLLQLFFLGGYLVAPHAVLAVWCLSTAWGRRD